MSYSPKYTTLQRVRYLTGLLTTDDLSDAEVLQGIEQAEVEIESWGTRDGVDKTTWSPTVPDGVVSSATWKASSIVLARKLYDARLATTESRSGTSISVQADARIQYFDKQAEETWRSYLSAISGYNPKTVPYRTAPVLGYFDEDKWRREGEEV